MKDHQLDDLKDFIVSTVSRTVRQTEVRLTDDFKGFVSLTVQQTETRLRDDLKDFVYVTVGQTETRLTQRMDQVEQRLEDKLDDGFAGVGEALSTFMDQDAEDKKLIDKRLTTLEQKPA